MHLLAVETGSLDEIDGAVDLGQTPADVVVLSFSDSDLSALASVWSESPTLFPTLRLASLKQLRHPMSVDLYIERVIAGARLVIVRGLGGLDYWRYGFEQIAAAARRHGIHFIALPGDDRRDARLDAISTVPRDVLTAFERYFRSGGPANARNALLFAAQLLGTSTEVDPPVALPAALALDASGNPTALENVESLSGKPVALVTFYRASLLAGDYRPITALCDALEQRGLRAIAVAVTSLKDADVANPVTDLIVSARPDVILNATAFSAMRTDETTLLDAADCPVLQVALAGHPRTAWDEASRGLSPSDLAMNVVLPELDGRLFTRAISFKKDLAAEPGLEYARIVHEPDAGRVAHVADLAAAWVRLRRKPREERMIALLLSDYPNRAGRTGYACGLDTPESVAEIVSALATAGYATGTDSVDAGNLIARLAGLSASDAIEIPVAWYVRHLSSLPPGVRDALDAAWGKPEEDPAFDGEHFRHPCARHGNLVVTLQPDRGARSDRKSGYHDLELPPRHAYVALYAWLREQERIDALLHMGTHGTLEWLPGKALALSETCFPEAVLGPLPVVYPFIVNNPGEAVQAKRRISAVTIGHMTPPLCEAGLEGPLGELEGLIEEYAEADGVDRRRIVILEQEILDRAWRSGLAKDCGLEKSDPPREAVAKLDAQLCDIKDLAIRDHLHVFGRAPSPESCAALAAAIVRAAPGTRSETVETAIVDCALYEREALIAALDGRRVAPGPAGAPTRGRRDVLPTGRNLTTIDPRAVPTRTAAIVGQRAADEVVRRYLQDHGDYPRALMLDLWASASLRTGGDDLAQALAFLGVRPQWDDGSNRVTGIEVLPIAKLDRPRIDVTMRISGSFRDIFPAQIALFDLAVRRVAERDEPDDWNPLAAARRKGESLARIFGGEPGTYGAGAASAALDGAWGARSDLATAYLEASSHVYGADDAERVAPEEFEDRIAATDALVHPQDDRERDLLDGDGVADFAGGFAAAAAEMGRSPALYHLDTSQPEAPRARTIEQEIVRIVRGRLTNPRWLDGMIGHGHRGVAEIAQGVDALYAFAATAGIVGDQLFDAVHDSILADEERLATLRELNAPAMHAIAARLEDAIRRQLWTPRRNAVHAELAHVLGAQSLAQRSNAEAAP
ncbi:cobaltochelatase [Hyphomicrobium nitrativorans NL23]|uniref:Cobaltochelatase n=1 Tax=Hyphomicrobium nitrativorans NL23 TaxID=1029756 RepID=V5SCF9_9HYPH|nr:cobaltochelatase subunit CobN [Hyphomicrobium nitrativorans]AHB48208.1 cobaltochelatase [Hyphomicrobium nitrativorans NL23]